MKKPPNGKRKPQNGRRVTRLSDLRTQRHNLNRHRPSGLQALGDSLARDGLIGGITVAADGETFDGSARLETLADAMPNVKIKVVDTTGETLIVNRRTDIPNTDDPRARRLGYSANAIQTMDWSPDAEMLAARAAEDSAVAALVRQEDASLKALAEYGRGQVMADAEPQIDRAEELLKKWKVKRGQVWSLGLHRLICGDSRHEANVSIILEKQSVSLWIVDPPYDVPYSQFKMPKGVSVVAVWHRSKNAILWAAETFRDEAWGVHGLVFTGGVRGQHNHTLPCCMHDNISIWRRHWWKKKEEAIDRDVIQSCGCKHTQDGRPISWQEHTGGVLTGTMGMSWGKPVLESDIVMAYVKRGSIVYDPCAGSGSTLLSAERHGRVWRGCEIQEKWAALIIQRYLDATGIAPELIQ